MAAASLRARTGPIRTKLGERYKPATANRYLSAVKGVLCEAWRLGEYPGEDLEKVRDVRSVPGSAIPAGRALSKGELKALMDSCSDGTPVGIRDAAVIALGYGAGLRRTEIPGLSPEDIRTEGAGMVVRVVGKGAKERLVYLDNGAMEAITDYIEARGSEPGPLLWSARKGGRLNEGSGMSDEAVAMILKKCAAGLGWESSPRMTYEEASSATCWMPGWISQRWRLWQATRA